MTAVMRCRGCAGLVEATGPAMAAALAKHSRSCGSHRRGACKHTGNCWEGAN